MSMLPTADCAMQSVAVLGVADGLAVRRDCR
jgi:hypothetical protein